MLALAACDPTLVCDLDRISAINVVVVDNLGARVDDAVVRASRDGGPEQDCVVGGAGVTCGFEPGDYLIRATKPGHNTAEAFVGVAAADGECGHPTPESLSLTLTRL